MNNPSKYGLALRNPKSECFQSEEPDLGDRGTLSFTNEPSDPFTSPPLIWLWLLAEDAVPPFTPNVTADQKTP